MNSCYLIVLKYFHFFPPRCFNSRFISASGTLVSGFNGRKWHCHYGRDYWFFSLTSAQPLGLKYSELTINLCACGDGGMAANMSHCKGVNYYSIMKCIGASANYTGVLENSLYLVLSYLSPLLYSISFLFAEHRKWQNYMLFNFLLNFTFCITLIPSCCVPATLQSWCALLLIGKWNSNSVIGHPRKHPTKWQRGK